MSNFEIVDRRGTNKPEEVVKAVSVLTVKELGPGAGEWLEVAYLTILLPAQQGPMPAGRAVGRRMDGVGPFVADWVFPPLWQDGFDWMTELRKRLDTFLNCECRPGESGACAIHKMYLPQWMQADQQRLELISNSPVPAVVELLMRGEMSAQARSEKRIVVPRG